MQRAFGCPPTQKVPLRRIRNLQHNVTVHEETVKAAPSSGASAEKGLVSNSAEGRYREVLAVAMPNKPLIPGGVLSVHVQNEKLIEELIRVKKNGCVASRSGIRDFAPGFRNRF